MAAKKKTEDSQSYTDSAAELQTILDEIETGAADIDVLSEKVERAAELIRLCREKLAGTELRVNKIVEELSAEVLAGDDAQAEDDE